MSVDRGQERIAHLMRLCARGFNRSLQTRLAAHEVSFGQWIFLRMLWRNDGLSQRELSKLVGVTEPTAHKAILRMERQGFLSRSTSPDNQRRQRVFLTDDGWALRDKLEPLAIELNETALDGVSDDDAATLRRVLLSVLHNLEEDERKSAADGHGVPSTRSLADV